MGFSSTKYQREKDQRPWKVNPVWRGIGCMLIIIIPIMSWFGATLFLQNNTIVPLPWQLTSPVLVPSFNIAQISGVVNSINVYLRASNLIYAQLFFTGIFMFIGFGIMSLVYAVLYRVAGPARYGPFDVPPNKVRR
jgi:hypothetical protein